MGYQYYDYEESEMNYLVSEMDNVSRDINNACSRIEDLYTKCNNAYLEAIDYLNKQFQYYENELNTFYTTNTKSLENACQDIISARESLLRKEEYFGNQTRLIMDRIRRL